MSLANPDYEPILDDGLGLALPPIDPATWLTGPILAEHLRRRHRGPQGFHPAGLALLAARLHLDTLLDP